MSSFACPVYLKHVSATWQRSGPAITFFKKRKEGWRKCESFQKCEGAAAVDWLHLNTGNRERDAELHHCCWPTLGAHACNHYLMQKWCCKCNKSESDDISFCACEFMKRRRLFLWKGSTDFWLSLSKMRQSWSCHCFRAHLQRRVVRLGHYIYLGALMAACTVKDTHQQAPTVVPPPVHNLACVCFSGNFFFFRRVEIFSPDETCIYLSVAPPLSPSSPPNHKLLKSNKRGSPILFFSFPSLP